MKNATRRPRGRPRSFDRDAALDRALDLFWRRGYEATSLADLTAAMDINPPSLYAAFGDKESLFMAAVDRYLSVAGKKSAAALAEAPTARAAVEQMLRAAAIDATATGKPRGCLVVTAATNCTPASDRIRDALASLRAASTKRLRSRIQSAVDSGELPAATDAAELAAYFTTVLQGMSIQARDGASRKNLLATVAVAMRAWPDRSRGGDPGSTAPTIPTP